jgi:Erv1 / Alr family
MDRDMEGEEDWFKSFVTSVPCPKCQKHFEEFLKVRPPDFSSRTAFFVWTVNAHNYVNEATKKRLVTLDEAYKMHHFLKDEEAP